jgi:hypothetical protein
MIIRRAKRMVRETFNIVDLLEVKQCESNWRTDITPLGSKAP